MPNGKIVNRPNGGGHLNIGGRVDPQAYHHQESMLGNSLLSQQAQGNNLPFSHQYPVMAESDPALLGHQPVPVHDMTSAPDTTFTSHPNSKYGSPREDIHLPMSPVMHTLDAPLPASFDSNGYSWMAIHGPVAASVPSKFGFESPPSSFTKKSAVPTDALRNLHDSAFGRDNRTKSSLLASSPSAPGDELAGQRMMHSQRLVKPKILSASLPRQAAMDEWDDSIVFGGEEDYLPSTLSHLLNPEEKTRRFSGNQHDPSLLRDSLSGHVTPAEISSKVGSPSTASPSRFSGLFTKQKREEETNGFSGSAFGHVGSPLRNSSLHSGSSPSLRASNRVVSCNTPPFISSPPRQTSMSMISQQLQRTRLSRAESSEGPPGLHHPGVARHTSNSSNRAVSSSSIGTSRIDEEQPDCIFSLDEEDFNGKRSSGIWSQSSEGKSPNLGPIGGGRQTSSGL